MELSREEIIDLAIRYIPENEVTDFPHNGDLFCLLVRQLPADRVLAEEEGWGFNGYGVCLGYRFDEDAKPRGKWLWMHFASLASFPPVPQVLKLQPPHVVKGRFQSADRTNEIRILKVALVGDEAAGMITGKTESAVQPQKKKSTKKASTPGDNIVAFRKKNPSEGDK